MVVVVDEAAEAEEGDADKGEQGPGGSATAVEGKEGRETLVLALEAWCSVHGGTLEHAYDPDDMLYMDPKLCPSLKSDAVYGSPLDPRNGLPPVEALVLHFRLDADVLAHAAAKQAFQEAAPILRRLQLSVQDIDSTSLATLVDLLLLLPSPLEALYVSLKARSVIDRTQWTAAFRRLDGTGLRELLVLLEYPQHLERTEAGEIGARHLSVLLSDALPGARVCVAVTEDFPSSLPHDVRTQLLTPGLLEPWHAHPNTQGLHAALDEPLDEDATDIERAERELKRPHLSAKLLLDAHMCRVASNLLSRLGDGDGAGDGCEVM